MPRDRMKTLTQNLARAETDLQRWADDGGRAPEPTATATVSSLPLRLAYSRPAEAVPFALSSAPPCATIPAS